MKAISTMKYALVTIAICGVCFSVFPLEKSGNQIPIKHGSTVHEEGPHDSVVPVLQSMHSKNIGYLVFSPDSQIIISNSGDKTLRLWNTNGKLIRIIDGFSGFARMIFSPDSKSFLTISGSNEYNRSSDTELKLWNLDGIMLADFPGHTKSITDAMFSTDGNVIMSFSREEKAVRIWNRKDKSSRVLVPDNVSKPVRSAGMSPDGKYIIATTFDNNTAYLWSSNKNRKFTLKHPDHVLRVAASPAGRYFATCAADKKIRLWDYNGKLVRVFNEFLCIKEHEEDNPLFSPDGSYIITLANRGNGLKLFPMDGSYIQTFNFNEVPENQSAKKLPAKNTRDIDNIWDEIEQEENRLEGKKPGDSVYIKAGGFFLSPDGELIASYMHGYIAIWNKTGRLLQLYPSPKRLGSTRINNGNKYIASVGRPLDVEERVISLGLWDMDAEKEKILVERDTSFGDHYGMQWSPDGKYLAYFIDTKISLYDCSGRLLHVFGEEVTEKNSLYLSSAGERLLCYESTNIYGQNFKIRHWNINGRLIESLDGNNTSFAGATQFPCNPSRDLRYILAWDCVLYDLEKHIEKRFETGPSPKRGNYDRMPNAMSPDVRHILSHNFGKDKLELRRIDGTLVGELEGNAGNGEYTGFSPDGNHIVRVNADRSLSIWGINCKLIAQIKGPVSTLPLPVSFSADMKYLVLGLESGYIQIYGLDGRLISSFAGQKSSMAMFMPLGGLIASAGADQNGELTFRLYDDKGMTVKLLAAGINADDLRNRWAWGYPVSAKASPDGNKFILCYGSILQLRDKNGKLVKSEDMSNSLPNGSGIDILSPYKEGIYVAGENKLDNTIKVLRFDWNLTQQKALLLKGHRSCIPGMVMDPERQLMISSSQDGTIKYWSMESGECIATAVGFKENAGIIYTPDGYYRLSGDAVNAVSFVRGMKTYSFEQFDLIYNRPDIVLERIYPVRKRPLHIQEDINRYREYWRHRIRQNGFTESQLLKEIKIHAPEVYDLRINGAPIDAAEKNVRGRDAVVSFAIRDEKGSDKMVIGYKIFVNGVPLHGQYIRRFDTPQPVQRVMEKITLSSLPDVGSASGSNTIEISGFTEDGIESNREAVHLRYEGADASPAKGDLYIVALGIDDYSSSKGLESLAYAVKDAKDITDTFGAHARGKYKSVVKMLHTEKDVSRAAISEIREKLNATSVDDTVVFFLSGHGLRADTPAAEAKQMAGYFGSAYIGDAGAQDGSVNVYYYMTGDSDADRPWKSGIPMDAIRLTLDGIPARQKLLLIDTCQSGENPVLSGQAPSQERLEEARKRKGAFEQVAVRRGVKLVQRGNINDRGMMITAARALDMKEMSEMFPELRRGTGTIEISAATGAQSALESEQWNNGAFTYCVKEAVLGGKARDAQGRITAKTLRKYILGEVEILTAGGQTPMVCRDIPGRDFTIVEK